MCPIENLDVGKLMQHVSYNLEAAYFPLLIFNQDVIFIFITPRLRSRVTPQF